MAADAGESRSSPTLFLCGDVMTGRGIDQIQARSVPPELHEPWVRNAMDYVRLAERESGPVPQPVDPAYVWGEALPVWAGTPHDLSFVNLETGITTSNDFWPSKGIHYRMHPDNVACLRAAGIDGCTLANNHVMDLGYRGLEETLTTLEGAGIAVTGAGRDAAAAAKPAVFPLADGSRVVVHGFALGSGGVPEDWAAGRARAGVNRLPDLAPQTADAVADAMLAGRRAGDVTVASIHWGGNWGYEISRDERHFARRLVDSGAADVIHGHSSHHPKGMERHRGKLILYGCGDFLNDYEGIGGHEAFRPWLSLMYFVTVDPGSGRATALTMVPLAIRRLRLVTARPEDAEWLARRLEKAAPGEAARIRVQAGCLVPDWSGVAAP
ncbi:CapA family protein [Lentisalinibacter salinarum]|uniref:CapA family protein n=1 Tax=Lentisalinibacter salinarum TaxID=2992239 RepID=UPI00386C06FC